MGDWREVDIEGGKSICTKEQGVKGRNYPVTSWCASIRTWRKIKDNRIGDKKLLVAKSNKRYRKICRKIQYVSENKEQNRGTSGKVDDKWGARKAIDILNSRFYHKITVGSRKRCNIGGMW